MKGGRETEMGGDYRQLMLPSNGKKLILAELSLADGHVVGRVLDCTVDWSMKQFSGGLEQLDVVAQVTQMFANLPLLK